MNSIHRIILSILVVLIVFFIISPKTPIPSGNNNKVIKKIQNNRHSYKPVPLTLEKIFSKNHILSNDIPKVNIRVLIATGDIIPARKVNYNSKEYKNYLWPYEKIYDTLNKGDITFINLEAPLIEDCQATYTGMVFCGSTKHIDGLVKSGVDVVNFANNHMGNYGTEGIDATKKLLNDYGILTTGLDSPVYKTVRGMKFAFLGYNEIGAPEESLSWADDNIIKQQVKEAKKISDVVVVTFHWGTEYVSQPTNRQRELAHLAIDSGADLIIGNHPHWIEPVELYKDKLITYAHGNTIFDQMWSEETKEGVIGKYTFYNNKVIDVEFIPVYIENYGQATFPDNDVKKAILDNMKTQSYLLSTSSAITN